MEVFQCRQVVAVRTISTSKHYQRDLQDMETYKKGDSCSMISHPKD